MIFQIQENLRQIPAFRRIVVGVSGGADSVCLALLLHELGYEIVIAHLNHDLRGKESDEDAAFVQDFAKKLRLPCVIHKMRIPRKGNLEANARHIRYTFLEAIRKKTKADFIAVAHHRDDQIETVLMNMCRGSGLRGMAGMSMVSNKLIRPFLTITKKEIREFLKAKKQAFREDKTNEDPQFFRNRLRHFIIPEFEKKKPQFKEDILLINERAREELKKVMAQANRWLAANLDGNRFKRENFQLLHHIIKGEILIQWLGAEDLYRKTINRLIRFIETAGTGKKVFFKGVIFTIEYDCVRVERKKKGEKTPPKKRITVKGVTWKEWKIKKSGRAPLFVRSRRPGDRFQPSGMRGSKKLQDFFVDLKIPKDQRDKIPIIVNQNDEIISVSDLRLSKEGEGLKAKIIIKK